MSGNALSQRRPADERRVAVNGAIQMWQGDGGQADERAEAIHIGLQLLETADERRDQPPVLVLEEAVLGPEALVRQRRRVLEHQVEVRSGPLQEQ